MRRREFFDRLAASLATVSSAASAQDVAKAARVGRLSPLSEAAERPMIEAFRSGLADLGWVEGRNLSIDLRFANGRPDRLPGLAEDLVRRQVDVIVTGSDLGALAAKRATGTIPVVFVTTGDPVAAGIVSSLARPGANLTGITVLGLELVAKRLQLLQESFGRLRRIAIVVDPDADNTRELLAQRERIASALVIELPLIEVRDVERVAAAFEKLPTTKAQGILVLSSIKFLTNPRRIVDQVAASRLPATYPDRGFVDAGGLMFYGAALPDMYRHAASHVDKILRGARAADIPVEQPTTFRLVINARAARALDVTLPPALIARADELVE